ncbi:MAG TPA: C25 family cysteine peptidase [Bacteriovoracaceae bacterium]|nr:C25 family cysteine peptidase [Bacteriovoracaceae bacterium]
MSGTAPQTFEAVDDIKNFSITNTTVVTLKNTFSITRSLVITGTGTTAVEGIVQLTNIATIPAGHNLIIKNGAALYANAGLTVNGTLKIEGGGLLRMGNGTTLSINTGASLVISGSSGNKASISSANSASWFNLNVAGSVTANYAEIKRTTAAGMNVTGNIIQIDNTDFRGMVAAGYAITLGAAASVPSSFNTVGFFNDDAVIAPRNINATLYNLTAININLSSGSVAGASFELDPNAKVNWVSTAPTQLTITNNTEANEPPATLSAGVAATFSEFAFTLNNADAVTNITQVILTMSGTASMSDIGYVRAYRDVNANCDYDAATDTQLGSDLVFSGSPLKATVTIPSGQLTTSSSTVRGCFHVVASAGSAPVDQKTINFSIASDTDVTNSFGYALSSTSGTPVSGSATTLVNTNYSVWVGGTSTSWNVAANWNPATLPSATRDCTIGLATRTTLVNTTPISCANGTLQSSGTLDFNSTASDFQIKNSLDTATGFNFLNAASGILTMNGTVNQTLSLRTAFPGNVVINNTGAALSNTVSLGASSTINGNLTCTAGILSIPNGFTLTVLGTVTVQTGCTLLIGAGGTLALANGRTLTVNSGGTLQMVGTSGLKSTMTSNTGTAAYNVVVNGTINARYYTFDHLNTAGVSIEAGASINATNFLQDGTYSYPVNSSTTLLKLKQAIPGNTLSGMSFAKNGSVAATIVNIDTTGTAAGTLTISSFSGDLGGESFDTDPLYVVNWAGELNTIAITQESTSPTPVETGATYNMGRFGLQQVMAGGSFVDTNVTTLALSLTGTGSATDVSAVRLYSNPGCTGTGGTLIGTGVFSGSPAKVTFTIASGSLVIPAGAVTTTKVCAYVEFDISNTGTNGSTVGVKLNSASDIVNSALYTIAASTTFPVTLGTASTINASASTTWTGGVSTEWNLSGNWSAGIPDSTKDCSIADLARDPIISVSTASCKSMIITTGIVVVNAGILLDIYGNISKTAGTFTNNGTLSIKDGGSSINHNIASNTALSNLVLAKTGTGTVSVNSTSLTLNSLSFSSATTTLDVPNGKTLILPSSVTVGQGTLKISGGGTLEMGNGTTITVSGGTFQIAGTNDIFPQNVTTKGKVQVTGGGTNSYNFTATSGTVDIVGFNFDRIGVNGLNIGGTTAITNLNGGQFTNLSTSYASVQAIQLNNTGALPTTATNIAWNWGAFNSFTPANAGTPTSAQSYKLVTSTSGCGTRSIDFTGWSGDWYESQANFDVTTKISPLASCTISLGGSASAVSLLSFTAVPYNSAVDVRWKTNTEQNHLGFNIYRADSLSSRFQQINGAIIRNLLNSSSSRGSYRFIDQDVNNGQRYYYYLEDVEVSGKKVMHGPVFATPYLTLGAPPADAADENSQINPNDPDDGGTTGPSTIPNPTYEDLGNGIVVVSKTSRSLRIEITPAAATFSMSSWDNTYEDVRIPGFSKMTLVGSPELPEKELLIEVQSFATTAQVIDATVTDAVLAGHKITPAPNYTLNGSGMLVPSYAPDAVRYGTASLYPAAYYSIETNLVSGNGAKYLKLKINPLRLNPVTQAINSATKIILDIGLDGDDWDVVAPSVNSQIGPYAVSNTLKIDYNRDGVYQIAYNDFIDSKVEGPFKNTPTNLWRLYYKNVEIPLEIQSGGNFLAGDYIRFYVPFTKELDSKTNQLILSPVDVSASAGIPMRMESIDANPTGMLESNEVLSVFTKTIEQNLKYVDGISLGDGLDHFFYKELISFAGLDTLSTTIALPEIDINNPENVEIKYHLRGRKGIFDLPVKHHLTLWMAGVIEDEVTFDSNERQVVSFYVPTDRFIVGNNTFELKIPGTYASATDYDFVLIDKIEVVYNGYRQSTGGLSSFSMLDSNRAHFLGNFNTSAINGYDITLPLEPKKLSNISITTPDAGVTYDAKFFANQIVASDNMKYFIFQTSAGLLKPAALSLNAGIETSLKDSTNAADLIIYGDENLIKAAEDLIERRRDQGLVVMTVTPAQVYGEFSHGIQRSRALKDFINTSLANWTKAPKFLLILGDGTYDPKDYNVAGLLNNEKSVLEKGTLPAPLISGRFVDFSSDNFFVTSNVSHIPRLSVGRLPTNDPDKIKSYVDKVINYESGKSAPVANLRKITFIADAETGNYEKFNELSQSMMSQASGYTNTLYDRTEIGSMAATKARINTEFSDGPLLISLLGHGAFDRFGDNIFNVTDAGLLNNPVLPIVSTWNCESAYFYDADKTYKSLGEELIFNPDGGAIVFMGSTTQTTPPAQAKLANNFFTQLSTATNRPWTGVRFGDLLYQAKISVGDGNYEKDIINSFSIIGDPSLMLPPQLFPDPPVNPVAASQAKKKTGLFGCSAIADDGSGDYPWHDGLPEWILYIVLMALGSRKLSRRTKV